MLNVVLEAQRVKKKKKSHFVIFVEINRKQLQSEAHSGQIKHAGRFFCHQIYCKMIFHYHSLTSTFSTTCLPKEQTLVDEVIIMFSELSY